MEKQQQPQDAAAKESVFAPSVLGSLEVNLEAMLKAGMHFGHQKSRRNPKMAPYIFGVRKGINIIDLAKSREKLEEAMEFISGVRRSGKNVLIVGTKVQAKDLVVEAAKEMEMPYVVERWLGGTFTNFKVIRARAKYLLELEEKIEKGELRKYTKFEQLKKAEEMEKLEKRMGGIKHMSELPGAVIAMSIKEDELAITEAQKMGIPVVAIADTNTDPTKVDYPVPANDDALSSLRLVLGYFCKALSVKPEKIEAPKKEEKEGKIQRAPRSRK